LIHKKMNKNSFLEPLGRLRPGRGKKENVEGKKKRRRFAIWSNLQEEMGCFEFQGSVIALSIGADQRRGKEGN